MARWASSCADCLVFLGRAQQRPSLRLVLGLEAQASRRVCLHWVRPILAVSDGYCRLCWQQARYQSKTAGGLPRGAVSVLGDGWHVPWHQLFFDRTQLRRPQGRVRKYDRRGTQAKPPPAPAGRPAFRWVQPRLFDAWRDFTRFNEDTDASLDNPWLAWGLYLAWQRGEARGWRRGLRFSVRRALVILLSRHQPGDTIRYSEIVPLHQALDLRSGRTAEVLQEMGVLDDDRQPAFRGLAGAQARRPGPRHPSRCRGVAADAARRRATQQAPRCILRAELHALRSAAAAGLVIPVWPLREVSREDVMDALDEVRGSRRSNVLVALRSLFGFCKKRKTIFRSPVQGIRVGDRTWGVIQPLSQDEIDQAAAAAATPEARLVVVLAAMHAVAPRRSARSALTTPTWATGGSSSAAGPAL